MDDLFEYLDVKTTDIHSMAECISTGNISEEVQKIADDVLRQTRLILMDGECPNCDEGELMYSMNKDGKFSRRVCLECGIEFK